MKLHKKTSSANDPVANREYAPSVYLKTWDWTGLKDPPERGDPIQLPVNHRPLYNIVAPVRLHNG